MVNTRRLLDGRCEDVPLGTTSPFVAKWWGLLLMITALSPLLFAPSTCLGFDTFEHRYIGNAAFDTLRDRVKLAPHIARDWSLALAELGIQVGEPQKHQSESSGSEFDRYAELLPLEFGDLPALAGDHSENPGELLEILTKLVEARVPKKVDALGTLLRERLPFLKRVHTVSGERRRFVAIRQQWQNMCAWMSRVVPSARLEWGDLPNCASKALNSYDKELRKELERGIMPLDLLAGSEGYSPPRSELAKFEQLVGYVSLAAKNKSHFPRYSWKVYNTNHRKALELASIYAKRALAGDDDSAYKILAKALIYEGFAQYFLHDSFASGHLGTSFNLQKELLQHIHDSLNKLGTRVRIPLLPCDLVGKEGNTAEVLKKKLSTGWIAFGDRHLFIPEATFHRFVVIHFATRSLQEVFEVLANGGCHPSCNMCTGLVFPVPTELGNVDTEHDDDRVSSLIPTTSQDIRVPPLYDEGWKLLAGLGAFGEGIFDLSNPDYLNQFVIASSLDLGYLRTTAPGTPNYFGVSVFLAADVRTSIYPLSIGYWFPAEKSRGFMSIRANLGLRIAEEDSFLNSGDDALIGAEATIVFDVGYQIRHPLGLFARVEMVSANYHGTRVEDLAFSIDSPFGNGVGAITFGVRYDLGKVVK